MEKLAASHEDVLAQKAKQLEEKLIQSNPDSTDFFVTNHHKLESTLNAQLRTESREQFRKFKKQIDPLIYRYFGLTDQDIALVEDTCDIFDKGDTPASMESARHIPTLRPFVADSGLSDYAEMICATLNGWAGSSMKVVAQIAVHLASGMALVELAQSKTPKPVRTMANSQGKMTRNPTRRAGSTCGSYSKTPR